MNDKKEAHKTPEIKILPNSVVWRPYIITKNGSQTFYANALVFTNKGTANVVIQDTDPIGPNESLSLSCDQNEIDTTTYRFTFPTPGGRLFVWAKETKGIFAPGQIPPYSQSKVVKGPNKRAVDKKEEMERTGKRNRNIKKPNSDL